MAISAKTFLRENPERDAGHGWGVFMIGMIN